MVKYFLHERSNNWVNAAYPHRTVEEINRYAKENNLEIVSLSCMSDKGVFVAFKERVIP